MPGETPEPVEDRSLLAGPRARGVSSIFIEFAFDQIERAAASAASASRPARGALDHGARAGGEHHQPHDRAARNRGAVLARPSISASNWPASLTNWRRRGRAARAGCRSSRCGARPAHGWRPAASRAAQRLIGVRASSCEATLMYLRPASWAPCTARSRASVWRTLASLISIGRLTPAMTSTLAAVQDRDREVGRRAAEHVGQQDDALAARRPGRRYRGCPPALLHIVVRRRCRRRRSALCGPTTCSSAATNSAASRPCVTKTMPIIGASPAVSP